MQPSELAEKAVEILDDRGHCKKKLMAEDGSVCLLGAVALAQGIPLTKEWGTYRGITELSSASREVVQEIIHSVEGVRHSDLVAAGWYNDRSDTTTQNVKDELMKAAKHFRNEGK